MSDELQNGDAVPETVVQAPAENQNIGAELATASEGQHESKPPVDDAAVKAAAAQEAIQQTINKKHGQFKQAERERDLLQGQLDTIEREKQETLAQSMANAPVIPVYPTDEFADDYEAKVSKFNQDISAYQVKVQEKAEFDANQGVLAQQQQYNQQQATIAQQAETQKIANEHGARSLALNINPAEMQIAQNTVFSYGITDTCLMHMASHADSPLLFKELAANPQRGFELAAMSQTNTFGVDTLLATIATAAKELQPKQVTAPAPIEQIKGQGAEVKNDLYPHSAGATFT